MSKIKIFKEILTAVGIWSLVGLAWQILEILMYGEIQPRGADTYAQSDYKRQEKRKIWILQVWRETGILPEDSQLSAPYL